MGITGMTPGGLGIWAILISALTVTVKAWPAIQRAVTEAKAAKGAESRARGDWYHARLAALEARLDASDTKYSELDRKFTLSLAAYRIVVSELHRINPKSAVIAQAQALLSPDMMAELPETPVEPVGPVPE